MNDDSELFVGVPSAWRDDVESRVAASPDPFVQFIWQHFAAFNGLLAFDLLRQPAMKRETFMVFVVQRAYDRFREVDAIAVANREAYPLEWFMSVILQTRIMSLFSKTKRRNR